MFLNESLVGLKILCEEYKEIENRKVVIFDAISLLVNKLMQCPSAHKIKMIKSTISNKDLIKEIHSLNTKKPDQEKKEIILDWK